MAQDMLQLYDSLKLCNPTMSLGGFCKAVSDAAWHTNLQEVCWSLLCAPYCVCCPPSSSCQRNILCLALVVLVQPLTDINTSAFRRAADEYSSCMVDLRMGVKQLNDLECPACSGGNCAYHVDSNMKLFVWDRRRETWRQPHFQEFIAPDTDMQLTLQAVDAARVCVCVCACVCLCMHACLCL